MHQLLDDYLCKKYPKIFADRHKPMNETCMCWGFSCGEGWYYLLDVLCSKIQYHIDNPLWVKNEKTGEYEKPKEPIPQLVADQVKEKFSSLRFYSHGGDDYCRALIDMAENMSYFICEECGLMDYTVGRNRKGWIKTTCSKHGITTSKEDFKPNGGEELQKIWEQVNKDIEEQRKKEEELQKKYSVKERGNGNAFDLMFDTPKNENK